MIHQYATIHALPVELCDAIFSYLDRRTLLSCALTCRRLSVRAQYTLYRSVRVCTYASASKLIRTLHDSPDLRKRVKEFALCGKHPHQIQPWMRGNADPLALIPHPALVPGLRALRLEHWDPVQLEAKFWERMRQFGGVTELHLHSCLFQSSLQLEELVFSFPYLISLALHSVRWVGDRQGTFEQNPKYEGRTLSLRKLSICNPCEAGRVFRWLRGHGCLAVRHLELIRFDVINMQYAATYVKELGPALESLTVGLSLPLGCDRFARRIDLGVNTNLRALALEVYDVDPSALYWAKEALESAAAQPLARVALTLTLDAEQTLYHAPWDAIAFALAKHWRTTLREAVVTHRWVPGFLRDAAPMFRRRFRELVERRVLAVIADQQDL